MLQHHKHVISHNHNCQPEKTRTGNTLNAHNERYVLQARSIVYQIIKLYLCLNDTHQNKTLNPFILSYLINFLPNQ